jgi:hypothetical protein
MALACLGRREFLQLAGGVWLLPVAPAAWWEARELVKRGLLGEVVFCRVSCGRMADAVDSLRFLFDGALPLEGSGPTLRYRDFVAGYEEMGSAGEPQTVVCGRKATLVVEGRGYRVYE